MVESEMSAFEQVREVLVSSLGLGERGRRLDRSSVLLGEIPEFDSMAVVTVVTALEEEFDIVFDDDEIDADVFATVGSLVDLVDSKLAA